MLQGKAWTKGRKLRVCLTYREGCKAQITSPDFPTSEDRITHSPEGVVNENYTDYMFQIMERQARKGFCGPLKM
jgi:hypothetical protein